MPDTPDRDLDQAGSATVIPFRPGLAYRALGYLAAMVVGGPSLLLAFAAPLLALPGLAVGVAVIWWARGEEAHVTPEGVWIRRLPRLSEEFVAWQEILEVALPIGALRSPWLWLSRRARVRLPMFVDSESFSDAIAIFAPDVLLRSSAVILHTEIPRGRWIEGVWICDAHRDKWCGPCNEILVDLSA